MINTFATRLEEDYTNRQTERMEIEAEIAEIEAHILDVQAQIDATNADPELTDKQKASKIKKLNRDLERSNEKKADLLAELLLAQTDEEAARLTAEEARAFANDKQAYATLMQMDADILKQNADVLFWPHRPYCLRSPVLVT